MQPTLVQIHSYKKYPIWIQLTNHNLCGLYVNHYPIETYKIKEAHLV